MSRSDTDGCSTSLGTFITTIALQPEDTIVTLGGYIDRGPDGQGVIDLLVGLSKRYRFVPLLGITRRCCWMPLPR